MDYYVHFLTFVHQPMEIELTVYGNWFSIYYKNNLLLIGLRELNGWFTLIRGTFGVVGMARSVEKAIL